MIVAQPAIASDFFQKSGIEKTRVPLKKCNKQYTFGFNGQEKKDDWRGAGNSYEFKFREFDCRIGRWDAVDPAAREYPSISQYVYSNNSPIYQRELDGKRFYFAAGAGNDPDKTGYPQKMMDAFKLAGIQNTVLISAHGGKYADVFFTLGENSRLPSGRTHEKPIIENYGIGGIAGGAPSTVGHISVTDPIDYRIAKGITAIKKDLLRNPLKKGEQFNISGYSTGSVVMAQVALHLANEGKVIDNLILIGSPISNYSELWDKLKNNINIKNIIKIDIEGDNVAIANEGGSKLGLMFSFFTKGNDHPHFKFAFLKNAFENAIELGKELIGKGVK